MLNGDRARLRDIGDFSAACGRAQTLCDLNALLDAATRQFGFRWFALVHNVDLTQRACDALMLTSYPTGWLEEVFERKLYLDDPAHIASGRVVSGLSWCDIPHRLALSARQRLTLERAAAHGLQAGFTLQIQMVGEPSGVFSLSRSGVEELSDEEKLTARLIGMAAFESARNLLEQKGARRKKVSLSPRQIDCVTLVARGKSDWEIAQILGLSRDTVHEYVESARHRYGVQRRPQLVLRALQDGYLTFDAAL